jgi:myo-inositol 2-dehydrogenase / D-chiro-inositol 1-dehydrogenase
MAVRIGVIGAGLMGSTHVRLLRAGVPGAEVVAVSDFLPANAERLAEEAGIRSVYGDGAELVTDPQVDAVIIASPAETHDGFVLACLEAGKPVLCEKPLAATAGAGLRVVEAEAALGRRLVQVGFMRRYDPAYAELKRQADAGAVGAAVLVHCVHRNPAVAPSFTSEMIITDTVVHEIDIVRWLLGAEIVRATVFAGRSSAESPPGLRDPQLVVFETDGGVVVDVEAFVTARYGYDIGCELVGESGTLSLAPTAPVVARRGGEEAGAVPAGYAERFATAYVRELQGWTAAIAAGDGPTGASAWDGYAATAVTEAAVASLHHGGPADVRLDAKPALYAGEPVAAG